jgi:superfamily I DNA/RNA helicase
LIQRDIPFKKQQNKGYFDNSICNLAMTAAISFFNNKGNEFNNLLQVLAGSGETITRVQVLNISQDNPAYSPQLNQALSSIRASHHRFSNGDSKTAIKLFFTGIVDRLTDLKFSAATRLFQLAETPNKIKAPSLEAKIRLLTSPPKEKNKDASVTLMTMHSSKGLEAARVFVMGVNNKVIPSTNALNEAGLTGKYQECIDEETRLMFVAITRAEDTVHITTAKGTGSQPTRYGPSQVISPLLE